MERLMSAPSILEDHELHSVGDRSWMVTVYDNASNTYDEVISILMIATHCDFDEAWIETWEIDHLGKSVVHCSDREECETVCEVIAQIGIEVEVSES